MKIVSKIILILSLLVSLSAYSQTPKKTATPVKKTAVKKTVSSQNNAAKAAAVTKAKEDSVAAVNALAMKMAKQIIAEDSIKKVQAAQQLAADEKIKQDQLAAEQKQKPSKTAKPKPAKKEVAKTEPQKAPKEPVKKIPDELRPTAKPIVAETDAKIWIGLRAMGIGSFLVGKDVDSYYKPYVGYGGGLVANFALGTHFSFQPEVLYAQEGVKVDGDVDGTDLKASLRANIIQLPLLLKYSFGEHNKGFFVNVGPYGNYIINSVTNVKTDGGGKTTDKPEKTTIDYGIAGGLGVAVPLGKGRLLVEARGTYFLGSTEKDEIDTDARIVTGTLSVGYLFPIGH